MSAEIDTFNKFMVSVQGDRLVLMLPIPPRLTVDDALILAAWIVAIAPAMHPTHKWEDVLSAVRNA
jgi:hypothetical protein